MIPFLATFTLLSLPKFQTSIEYDLQKDIPYRADSGDAEIKNRCRLDVYAPNNSKGYATLIWFHGG